MGTFIPLYLISSMNNNNNPFMKESKKMESIKRTTLTLKELKTIKEAIKIIQGLSPHDNDMNIELWGKDSPFNGMLRIKNSYQLRGLIVNTNLPIEQVSEIFSKEEIKKS